eukprot:1162115-Pelagomonas_calceolata.AAC.14
MVDLFGTHQLASCWHTFPIHVVPAAAACCCCCCWCKHAVRMPVLAPFEQYAHHQHAVPKYLASLHSASTAGAYATEQPSCHLGDIPLVLLAGWPLKWLLHPWHGLVRAAG